MRYLRLQRVTPRSLLRMRKCTCKGYLAVNSFFQIEGMGFFLFDKEIRHGTAKLQFRLSDFAAEQVRYIPSIRGYHQFGSVSEPIRT